MAAVTYPLRAIGRSFARVLADLRREAPHFGGNAAALMIFIFALFTAELYLATSNALFSMPNHYSMESAGDLPAFYRAGELARAGAAPDAYDPTTFQKTLREDKGLLWLNPPHMLLLVAPLSALAYSTVKIGLIVLMAASLFGIGAIASPRPAAPIITLLSPGAFISFVALQIGGFIALGLSYALKKAEHRPMTSGLLLALLTVKPQYGLMAPVFLAAIGAWRTIMIAAMATIFLALASLLIFGIDVWLAFIVAMTEVHAAHASTLHRDMINLPQSIGKLGGGDTIRLLGQLTAIGIGGGIVWHAAKKWRREAAIGMTLLLSAYVSPSLWVYDWPLVCAGLFFLMRTAPAWPIRLQIAAGLLWIAPLITFALGTMHSGVYVTAIYSITLGLFWLLLEKNRINAQ